MKYAEIKKNGVVDIPEEIAAKYKNSKFVIIEDGDVIILKKIKQPEIDNIFLSEEAPDLEQISNLVHEARSNYGKD